LLKTQTITELLVSGFGYLVGYTGVQMYLYRYLYGGFTYPCCGFGVVMTEAG
jgi:hypothetical protein